VHLLFATVTRGIAVQGPMIGAEHAFVHTREWLGTASVPPSSGERERALAELARRYLGGHGPATDADLARWAGLPLRDARAGLRTIGGELVEIGGGLVDLASRRPDGEQPDVVPGPASGAAEPATTLPPRLLPSWARASSAGPDASPSSAAPTNP
jgi:hypothetical protein